MIKYNVQLQKIQKIAILFVTNIIINILIATINIIL